MSILALDLSTKSTGWAIGKEQCLQQHGCIVKKSKNVIDRIIQMREQLSSIIKQKKIDKIVMEEVRPDFNSHTGKVLIWLQAAIVIAAYEISPNIQFDFINASEWRAILKIKQGRGIRREQLKPKDIQYVRQKYNIEVNDDEADAICILDAYYLKINNEINWE